MKGIARKSLLVIVSSLLVGMASAQEQVKVTFGADVISTYIWRGMKLGDASLQPALGVEWKGLSLSAGGSIGLSNAQDAEELDLTLKYTTGGLSFGIVDYWSDIPEERYFNYKSHETNHIFEGFIAYDFGLLSASWQTYFAGNEGVNKQGKRAYSSYAELQAPFRLAACEWQATLGVVPYATTAYGTTGFAVTNVSLRVLKSLKITDHFSLPIFAQMVANPCLGNAHLIFGLTITAD